MPEQNDGAAAAPRSMPTPADAGAEERRSQAGEGPPPLVRRLLALAWRYRRSCLAILALSVLEVALGIAAIRTLGLGIDHLRHALAGGPAPVWPLGLAPSGSWTPWQTTCLLAAIILAIAVLTLGIRFAHAVLSAWVMQGRLVVELRSKVYEKLQWLSFRFYDGNETGSIIQRVTSDVQGMREFVEVVVLQTVTILISLLLYLATMLSIHVPLTVACLLTTPLMWWLVIRFSKQVRPAYRESREEMDRLVRHLVEDVQGVHVIKGFALEEDRRTAFDAQNRQVRTRREEIFRRVSVFVPQVHMCMQINMAVLLGYGGWLVIEGSFGLGGGLIVFAGLLQQLAGQVQNIAQVTNSMQNSLTGAARVFEILDAPIEVADVPDARPLDSAEGELRFEGVSFAYAASDPVLDRIDLVVPPGRIVAVLGETGAGKSSLLALIPRFYDPSAGRILLDGVDLRQLRLKDLRRQVGMVFQESFLFSTTVAANIAFGVPEATRAQIEQAARIAQADTFIADLTQGYDTVIGERGANLSGGQRQRLAIARAILTDPRILLLDDATAAIDPETEHEIMAAMESAMQGRTTFIVAHRLSTLRRADLIVVLDHGRIIQQGDHEQLMAEDGPYRTAARLQQAQAESKRLLAMRRPS